MNDIMKKKTRLESKVCSFGEAALVVDVSNKSLLFIKQKLWESTFEFMWKCLIEGTVIAVVLSLTESEKRRKTGEEKPAEPFRERTLSV